MGIMLIGCFSLVKALVRLCSNLSAELRNSEVPQDVFRAQETIMRFICETSCLPIVQQVVGQTLVTNYARGSCIIAKQVAS